MLTWYFFSLLYNGEILELGMPARLLIPVLFVAGVIIQTLILAKVRDKRKYRLVKIALGVILLFETLGYGNGLFALVAVCFTWPVLLGALLTLIVFWSKKRLFRKRAIENA